MPLSLGGVGAWSPSNTMWPPAWAEAYLRTKWHHNPSNRLATIHQRYRQDRQRSDRIGRTVFDYSVLIVAEAIIANDWPFIQFFKQRFLHDIDKYSFSNRVVDKWN